MADLAHWPDPHHVLMELFDDIVPSQVVGPRLYVNFERDMPVIRVRKIGGTNDKLTDIPRMAIDCYALTYPECLNISETCRQRLMSYPHITSVGRLDRCEVEASPFEVPWPDTTLRYLTAVYRLSFRR